MTLTDKKIVDVIFKPLTKMKSAHNQGICKTVGHCVVCQAIAWQTTDNNNNIQNTSAEIKLHYKSNKKNLVWQTFLSSLLTRKT